MNHKFNKLKVIFVTALLSGAVLTAQAQTTNPLLQLLGTVAKIGKEITGPVSAPSTPAPPSQPASAPHLADDLPNNVDTIMKALAESSQSLTFNEPCDPAWFKKDEQAALAKIQNGDQIMGGTQAKLNAHIIAYCASKNLIPMQEAAQIAGRNLAISAIALHKAGMDTTENLISAQNALTLLNLEPTQNARLIAALKSSGVLPAAPPTASREAAYAMTAADAASQLMANNFAFNHKYAGKTLKITGKVHSVSGEGQNVFIIMDGVPQADPGINDQVTCTISNQAYTNAAMSISKGQKVTVQGIYTVPNPSWMQAGVGLQDCHIVN